MHRDHSVNPAPENQATDVDFDSSLSINENDREINLLSRISVFENTVFSVYADHIVDKNQHRVERYLSVVPVCLVEDSIAGVAVLPIRKGKLGLIRIYRHPLGRWSWEVIKGHVEPGEKVSLSAVRELREEAGFSVLSEELIDFGAASPEAGVIRARTRLFAVDVSEKIVSPVDRELGHGEMAFISREEVYGLIANGEIEDASTLVLVYKYLLKQILSNDISNI